MKNHKVSFEIISYLGAGFSFLFYCACPENIHILPTEPWKGLEFPVEGGGFCKTQNLKECVQLYWNSRGGGVLQKIPSRGGMNIFWNYTLQ